MGRFSRIVPRAFPLRIILEARERPFRLVLLYIQHDAHDPEYLFEKLIPRTPAIAHQRRRFRHARRPRYRAARQRIYKSAGQGLHRILFLML